MIRIISAGPEASIQDMGRFGHAKLGVGRAGAMDARAFQLANVLLGNDGNTPAIECAIGGFEVAFDTDCQICVGGAGAPMSLDGVPLSRYWVQPVCKGQILKAGYSKTGMRLYLAVRGGIDVPRILGSASTDTKGEFGGIEGRKLRTGDVLTIRPTQDLSHPWSFGLSPRHWPELWASFKSTQARFIPAREWDALTSDSQESFLTQDWRVEPSSNRIGFRLGGAELRTSLTTDLLSHAILPGTIQLPPMGQPVVQMMDANTAGGYPKIGVVIDADLPSLAQTPLGGHIRFTPCSVDEARLAARALEEKIQETGRLTAFHRQR